MSSAGRPAVRLAGARSKYQGQSEPTASAFHRDFSNGRGRKGDDREAGARATPLNDAVDWRRDLGGGTTVALVQAGTFRSDAGALFGPVPRILWDRWVTDEIDAENRLLQALNCLLIETPAGRVLVETGIGDRRRRQDPRRCAATRARGSSPALRTAGFDPATVDVVAMSHLHFDHAGGLLAGGWLAGLPAGHDRRPAGRVGDRPRRQPAARRELRPARAELVRDWGAEGWADGERELLPGVSVVPTGGHSAGHQAIVVRAPGAAAARLLRRPLHAAVEREPALGDGVRRLPARPRSRSRRRSSPRPPTRSGPSSSRTRSGSPSAGSSATAIATGGRPPDAASRDATGATRPNDVATDVTLGRHDSCHSADGCSRPAGYGVARHRRTAGHQD